MQSSESRGIRLFRRPGLVTVRVDDGLGLARREAARKEAGAVRRVFSIRNNRADAALASAVRLPRRGASHDKTERLCVEAAYEVTSDERNQIGIVQSGFAMAAFPHKKTPETMWQREGGQITLLVKSGLDSTTRPIGISYGSIARMIVLYLQTRAVKTPEPGDRTRRVDERVA